MMNTRFNMWETVKVIFVNEKEIVLEHIKEIKEDDSGYVHFIDWYRDDVFIANKDNIIGFYKE